MKMKDLIKDWEQSAEKFKKLGLKTNLNPIKQEGLLCQSEVYDYCASKLKGALSMERWRSCNHEWESVSALKCEKCGMIIED